MNVKIYKNWKNECTNMGKKEWICEFNDYQSKISNWWKDVCKEWMNEWIWMMMIIFKHEKNLFSWNKFSKKSKCNEWINMYSIHCALANMGLN